MMIDTNILHNLPPGFTFLRTETIKDMDDNNRVALVLMWFDKWTTRKAYFCAATGEYLGEAF